MNEIALSICVHVDDWTVERAIIASNELLFLNTNAEYRTVFNGQGILSCLSMSMYMNNLFTGACLHGYQTQAVNFL